MKINQIFLTIIFSLSILGSLPVHAQQEGAVNSPGFTLRGEVGDATESLKLKNVVVMLLQAKDSILVDFTRTDAAGKFSLANIKSENYLLLLTHPDYAEFFQSVQVEGVNQTLSAISMTLKSKLIEEVLVSGVRPITIKGDTTEFDPRAFKVDANAKVEDLIKKFPGIQVDASGNITAFGEQVEKVLIDGEEFFGNDPILVTRNIRSDMVSKVQVFDKKSEESELTGVDDGTRQKTMNIVLKDDKKKGYFGKANAGVTHNELYQLQGMVNRFRDKLRVSAYATRSTTNLSGLSGDDSFKLFGMDSFMAFEGEDGVIMAVGPSGGQTSGIPKVFGGGVFITDKKYQDKIGYTIDYELNNVQNEGFSRTLIQDFLPTGTQFSTQMQNSTSRNTDHALNTKFNWKLDSLTTVNLNLWGGLANSDGMSSNQDFTLTENKIDSLNRSERVSDNLSEKRNFRTQFVFNKRLMKPGRSFSFSANQNYAENTGNGSLVSESKFFAPNGELLSVESINQRKMQDSKNLDLAGTFNWREPLTKKIIWTTSANSGMTRLQNDNQSWNRTPGSTQESIDSLYTNELSTRTFRFGIGQRFNYNSKNFYVNLGGKIDQDEHFREDAFLGSEFSRKFLQSNYTSNIGYTFPGNKRLNFNLNGRSQAPSLEQLQPLRQNTNPLYIQTGNLDLEQSYNHSANFSFNQFSVLTNRYIYVSGGLNFTNRPIIQNSSTDEVGRTLYFSQNLTGNQPLSYNLYASYDQPIKKLNTSASFSTSWNAGTSYSMVNQKVNAMDNENLSVSMGFRKDLKIVEYYLNFTPSYVVQKSSLQPETNNEGWNYRSNITLNFNLPAKFKFYSTGNYSFQPATAAFSENLERFIINMRVEKRFLKTDNLVLQLSVDDLLNDGTGYTRRATQNRLIQQEQNYLGRYFMLGLKWDFNIMGK